MNAYLLVEENLARQKQKLITLSKYVQKYPQGWKKRLKLANLFYEMGNWQQAIAEYYQVIERQPQLIDVWLQLGKVLHLMGLEKEALEIYEKALLLSENEGTQHHIKGLIAVCRGESQKAIIAFNLAAALEPEKVVHWLALAQVHQRRENPFGTLSACERVLSINPDDVFSLIYSYDGLMAVGDIPAARERLSRLIALAGDDFRVLQRQINQRCQMSLVSGKEGKLTKKMITSALRQAPHGVEAHNSLAYYYILRGDWVQGVEMLTEFTAEHPHHPYGWYYYGRCLFETGEYQKAVQMMEKAYHLYPHDCEIYRALCEILSVATSPPTLLLGEGSKTTLASILEEMLKRFPECWSVWATAGRVLVEHFQEFERGCSVSEQGTQLQPQLADAWFRHGRVLALAGRHREAVEALEKGWHILPRGGYLQSVPAAVWLGDVGASKQWWKTACEGCQELRAFNPAMADYWLGRALVGLGDSLGAIQAYESALSQQLLYPARGEVEKTLQGLKGKGRKDYGG
ncbi:tetratricopeptide repeat protein [Anabaena cylindrica FACHB-243]|uniref:Tetratricopeptide TPR_2 repeat-containing protein n=2 Tax=Nostocaceae TaxID=1162 RepID=K9ZJF7_ANACC|nr:Tetratricopeptide TPR_2 repeat-containing protein [Anabaena cylindrica PCC 7122]MBD2419487.1 tetratricopeptide repeat protein [Anabaena cylindrica FACHB-243]MBY5283986.1 tetratricopeptide repeat protein [Anabaena sp. CCAP 1446/1C]MBY5310812.1 tetratricopeptide repeat protein [Anabaena sp. CCAP 1446/1C]